jgi:hypothetical protein
VGLENEVSATLTGDWFSSLISLFLVGDFLLGLFYGDFRGEVP